LGIFTVVKILEGTLLSSIGHFFLSSHVQARSFSLQFCFEHLTLLSEHGTTGSDQEQRAISSKKSNFSSIFCCCLALNFFLLIADTLSSSRYTFFGNIIFIIHQKAGVYFTPCNSIKINLIIVYIYQNGPDEADYFPRNNCIEWFGVMWVAHKTKCLFILFLPITTKSHKSNDSHKCWRFRCLFYLAIHKLLNVQWNSLQRPHIWFLDKRPDIAISPSTLADT